MSITQLSNLFIKDITIGIDGTYVKAGFIKMAVSDDGLTPMETKNMQAAVLASQQTGAIIASHTIGGKLVESLMNFLEHHNHNLHHFIWTHAQSEPNIEYHIRAAQRGAFVSIDAIGSGWVPDKDMLHYTLALIDAGYSENILLSHDAGWYDPSQPDGQPSGSKIRGFTALFDAFIPALLNQGVSPETITQITIKNPAAAFSLHR
jgi:phosphotriesterase-related protein